LSYHIAVKLGKNVDQPRNLAKSVTVEWFFPTPIFVGFKVVLVPLKNM
jgi:hypothetical protein